MRLPRYIVPAVLLLTTIGRTQPQTDPAFEALVSRKMLDAALQTLEPAMLIEAVEKVAAAEKTLKKPYSVPLSGLMRVTFRAASQKRNAGVLDRLIVVAKGIPDDEMVLLATLARANARNVQPPDDQFMVALDQLPADGVARVRGWMNQIYTAGVMGNREDLLEMQTRIKTLSELDSRIVGYLTKRIETSLASLPEKADLADKLTQEARNTGKKEPKEEVKKKPKEEKKEPKEEPKEEPQKDRVPPKNFAEAVAALADGPDALLDEGFEGKFDMNKLGKAFKEQNASALVDLAIRMAQEEEVLDRKHQFVPSDMIFKAAIAVAMLKEDEKVLARIEKQLKFRGEKSEAYTRFVAQRQLGSSSRKGNKPLMVSLETIADGSYESFRYTLDLIEAGRRSQDGAGLRAVRIGLDPTTTLSAEQRRYLRERTTDALKAVPETPDEGMEILRLLGEASARSEMKLPALNSRLLGFVVANINKPVGDGKSATLIREGCKAIRAITPAMDTGDWGKKLTLREVIPGDVIRFVPTGSSASEFGIVLKSLNEGRQFAVYRMIVAKGAKVSTVSISIVEAGKAGDMTGFRPVAK